VVSAKVIGVASRDLGRNILLSDGFALGTLPGGGYGIRWRKRPIGLGDTACWSPWEPGGLGATTYWIPRGPPHDPVLIKYDGQEFIFCRDTAAETDVAGARRLEYEQSQEGR
jgi:hypothetical protein